MALQGLASEHCGEYGSRGASICHPGPCPGLSHDAINEPHTVECVAEVVTVSLCVLCRRIHTVRVTEKFMWSWSRISL